MTRSLAHSLLTVQEELVAQLWQLLQEKLTEEELDQFLDSDLRLLVRKHVRSALGLRRATKEGLQGPPGPATNPILIGLLLEKFQSSAGGATASLALSAKSPTFTAWLNCGPSCY